MFTILSTYTVLSLGVLVALGCMILKIGAMLGDCPQSRALAKSAAVTIATGYVAIGAGGVLLIGAVLPVMAEDAGLVLIAALGLAVLCLGLGFSQAISTLRAVLRDATAPEAVSNGLEPVLE